MIRHVSVITFVDGTSDAAIAAIEGALGTLPGRLSMVNYAFGRDLGLSEGNAGFGVVADFENLAEYLAYRDDPEHQRILAELIRPVLASRTAMQYEIT